MNQPVAIVGMACRFPGDITSLETLWEAITEGRNCWTNVPKDRFNEDAFLHPNPDFRGGHNHQGGHFLSEDLAAFDSQFFGLSTAEVDSMDPQQRLLLELSYEAFESAGLPIGSIRGSDTSVFVAVFTHDYDRILSKDLDDVPKYYITGVGEAILSNRISYLFDLHGPSMTLNTGCSGSLVALHQACQNLRTEESSMALVAGVNVMLTPDHMIGMSNFNMLNDKGKSFAFDDRGSGYGRGEGCAAIVLKRLDDAQRCNDPIRAVICSSGVNQDGKTSGITRPNSEAQARLATAVLQKSGMRPQDIQYVEAHGTGTDAGDCAELQSIVKAYCSDRTDALYVGSIKSNIGHLESVSGLAGLLKAILVIEKGYIPPQANVARLKPELQLDNLKVMIPRELVPLQHHQKRVVTVNSFGYGGTNAHVILKQAPGATCCVRSHTTADSIRESKEIGGNVHLFTISARSEQSLRKCLINLRGWTVSQKSDDILRNLAFTLGTRRAAFDWRSSFVATSSAELSEALDRTTRNGVIHRAFSKPKTIFLFTGQGAQWAGMGRELTAQNSPFTASLLRSDKMLQRLGATWHLMDEIQVEQHRSRINHSEVAQPMCTALQIALVDLFAFFGIKPSTVIGHSSGEIGAAYAAGILSQGSAMKVAYHRGLVSTMCRRETPSKGAMLAVGLGADEVETLIARITSGKILVACINSPSNTTVSGDVEGIDELKSLLDTKSIINRRLNVDAAYHSHHMLPASEYYKDSLKDLSVDAPRSALFISTVTGSIKVSDFGADYWITNLISTVRYRQAIEKFFCREMKTTGAPGTNPLFIEIGPHSVLTPLTRDIVAKGFPKRQCQYVPTLIRGSDAIRAVLNSVGRLFEAGLQIDLSKVQSLTATECACRCISDLPPYAWDHSKTYWHESRLSKQYRFSNYPYHDLLGVRIPSSTLIEPRWRNLISVENQPWLKEHRVNDQVVYPGAAYICMALEAIRQTRDETLKSKGSSTYLLKEVSFIQALILREQPTKTEIQLSLSPPSPLKSLEDSWWEFRITAIDSKGTWAEYCSGHVGVVLNDEGDAVANNDETYTIFEAQSWNFPRPCREHEKILTANELYYRLEKRGNSYGPTFAVVKELLICTPDRATALVEIPDVSRTMPYNFMNTHIIHPMTLDALMHSSLPLFQMQKGEASVMPLSVGELRISSRIETKPGTQLVVSTQMRLEGPNDGIVQLSATSSEEPAARQATVQISNMRIRGFACAKKNSMDDKLPVWTIIWEPVPDFNAIADIRPQEYSLQRPIEILRYTDLEGSGKDISKAFIAGLHRWASNVGRTSWDGIALDKNYIYIVLDNGKRPMLANLTEDSLAKLITVVTSEVSILWISLSTDPTASTNPERSLINGFARSAHAENDKLQLYTLDIQQPWSICCDIVISAVANLLNREFSISHENDRKQDRELVFRDGQILSPRIVPAPEPTEWVLGAAIEPDNYQSIGLKLEVTKTPVTFLDGNATYVVAGGLGFIGRKLCDLMAKRGARHLVVLSRRRLSAIDEESEVGRLRAISPTVRLYCFACDVSVSAEVEKVKASLAAMGLPPVKGVVQATVVLNDQLLAKMTIQKFNSTLRTKLHGTRNLSEAFESDSLQFFVLLSSLTAAVGTRGQANYTAGNAFQDAFAYSCGASKAHYMSVSPGMIQDADVNDEVRERNLRLHGLVPVSVDDLMSLLEYSMTPQAKLDRCTHALIGFNEQSLVQVDIRNANVHSAMFSHVVDKNTKSQSQRSNDIFKSLQKRIKGTKDPTQIKRLVATAIAKKMAELTSAPNMDEMMHKSLVDLGLDSLSTLDLSNWTSYSFGITLKPSEFMEMDNALALTDLIYDRSYVVKEAVGNGSNNAEKHDRSGPGTPSTPADNGIPSPSGKAGLPALPLPDLENTLNTYLECLCCSRSPMELKITSEAIREFLDQGFGHKLQDRLRTRADDPTIDSWQSDLYASNIYLKRRDPVHPFTTFYGGHILTENCNSQAKKAAIISAAALNFRRQMSSGILASDELHGDALCRESWAWLFNACREPHAHADKMRKYPGNDYVVVLRRGHVFKVSWRNQDGIGLLSSLERAFKIIIGLSNTWQLSAASLTADDRASWASIRQSLLADYSSNRDTLETIEAAAFVICLSDGSPMTPSQRCNQFFLGNPSNRWSDKNLQFVVCDNGASA